MVARARAAAPPGGRLLGLPIGPLRVAAALFLAVTLGMWWLCVPPFECSYMQALEAAARDHGAVPGQKAEAFAKRYGLPHEIRGSIEAQPVAATKLDFWFWHLEGVRLDYVAADGSVVQVVACDSPEVHPSIRRRVSRDGMDWWILETAGRTVVAFELAECGPMYAVTAPATDDSAYAAAKALRSSLR